MWEEETLVKFCRLTVIANSWKWHQMTHDLEAVTEEMFYATCMCSIFARLPVVSSCGALPHIPFNVQRLDGVRLKYRHVHNRGQWSKASRYEEENVSCCSHETRQYTVQIHYN